MTKGRTLHILENIEPTPLHNPSLLLLRLMVVAGQSAALLIALFLFQKSFWLMSAFVPVFLSAIAAFLFHHQMIRHKLFEKNLFIYLFFDTIQLSALLYLTGGIQNPFALMMLIPLAVGATLLEWKDVKILLILNLLCTTIMSIKHGPLPWYTQHLSFPFELIIGLWIALCISSIFMSSYLWSIAFERRLADERLKKAQLVLADEMRLASLGTLAASTAHNLATPLATLHLIASDLKKHNSELSQDDRDLLLTETKKCQELLRQLGQTFRHNLSHDLPSVPFSTLLLSLLEKHVPDTFEFHKNHDVMILEQPELKMALQSILDNAFEHKKSKVFINLDQQDDFVILKITDDGDGFENHYLNLLNRQQSFIPYQSSKKNHMGLGLFLSKVLIEKSGGRLRFENQKGACCIITWNKKMLEESL